MKLRILFAALICLFVCNAIFAQETMKKDEMPKKDGEMMPKKDGEMMPKKDGEMMSGKPGMSAMMKKEAVKIGDTALDFTLNDEKGNAVTLSEAVKKSPVVLVFYRGYWCPFCARQLADLRELNIGKKAQIFAVSIDNAEKNNGLKQKIEADGKSKINFSFLSDAGAKTIDAYGLRDERYAGKSFDGIPRPTVLVIDKERVIRWAKISDDYKLRPSNDEIRMAVNDLK